MAVHNGDQGLRHGLAGERDGSKICPAGCHSLHREGYPQPVGDEIQGGQDIVDLENDSPLLPGAGAPRQTPGIRQQPHDGASSARHFR